MATAGRPSIVDGDAVRALQSEGKTQRETAVLLGISLSTVQTNWARADKAGRPRIKQQEIIDRLKAGETPNAIADALDISVATVRRAKRELTGVTRPYRKKSA